MCSLRSRRKGDHAFLVAIYECYEFHALENPESNRLYCSKGEWIGTRPVCTRIEGTDGDGDNDEPSDCKFEIILYILLEFVAFFFLHIIDVYYVRRHRVDLNFRTKKKRKCEFHTRRWMPASDRGIRRFHTSFCGTPLLINLLIRNAKNKPFHRRYYVNRFGRKNEDKDSHSASERAFAHRQISNMNESKRITMKRRHKSRDRI